MATTSKTKTATKKVVDKKTTALTTEAVKVSKTIAVTEKTKSKEVQLVTRKDDVGLAVGKAGDNFLKARKNPNGTVEILPDTSSRQGVKFFDARGTLITQSEGVTKIGVIRKFNVKQFLNKANELY